VRRGDDLTTFMRLNLPETPKGITLLILKTSVNYINEYIVTGRVV